MLFLLIHAIIKMQRKVSPARITIWVFRDMVYNQALENDGLYIDMNCAGPGTSVPGVPSPHNAPQSIGRYLKM